MDGVSFGRLTRQPQTRLSIFVNFIKQFPPERLYYLFIIFALCTLKENMAQLIAVNRLLLVFTLVLVGSSSTATAFGLCVRHSPEEIWYSDFSPQLNTSLEGI